MSDEQLIVVLHDAIAIAADETRSSKERDAALTWAFNLLKQLPIEAIKKTINPS